MRRGPPIRPLPRPPSSAAPSLFSRQPSRPDSPIQPTMRRVPRRRQTRHGRPTYRRPRRRSLRLRARPRCQRPQCQMRRLRRPRGIRQQHRSWRIRRPVPPRARLPPVPLRRSWRERPRWLGRNTLQRQRPPQPATTPRHLRPSPIRCRWQARRQHPRSPFRCRHRTRPRLPAKRPLIRPGNRRPCPHRQRLPLRLGRPALCRSGSRRRKRGSQSMTTPRPRHRTAAPALPHRQRPIRRPPSRRWRYPSLHQRG